MHRHSEHHDSADKSFDALLQESLSEYAQKQEAFTETIAPFNSWHIDEEAASLSLTGDGKQDASFQLTPIGTYLPESESFAWAWANEAFPESSRHKASRITELIGRTGYRIFEVPQFLATATDIDELCALALHVLNGSAVFKTKSNVPWVFYVVE